MKGKRKEPKQVLKKKKEAAAKYQKGGKCDKIYKREGLKNNEESNRVNTRETLQPRYESMEKKKDEIKRKRRKI